MSRTKIVCTIGPASQGEETLRGMLRAGMDVARLNFSHGDHEFHRTLIERLRAAAAAEGQSLAIMQDLAGPKVRIGRFAQGKIYLRPGDEFMLTADDAPGDESRVHVQLPGFHELARGCSRLLLADGMIELAVLSVEGHDVRTRVEVGGFLADRKGISFPGQPLSMEPLTEKDLRDLAFGLAQQVDYVALSFVRSAGDIRRLRGLIAQQGSSAKVIAKIERPEALADLDAILEVSDAVMVARGDLGIELAPEKVPIAQKRIIREAQRRSVYVITATQMLESMIQSAQPTRAEASDVANAVLDGTDAVMLSGETASGEHPIRVVEVMQRITREVEASGLLRSAEEPGGELGASFAGSIAWAAVEVARKTGARAICAFTQSGQSAKHISKLHPPVPVIGLTPSPVVLRQLSLAWGVTAVLTDSVVGFDEMSSEVDRALIERGLAQPGDTVLTVAGYPFYVRGLTNLMKLHRVGMHEE